MICMSNLLKYTRCHDLESQRLETIWAEVNLKSFNVLICCFYRSDFTATQSFLFLNHQDNMPVCFIPPYTPLLCGKTGVYRGLHYFLIFALNID